MERERFEKTKMQRQTLLMFHNLLKSSHDGIIILEGENIILHNEKIDNIYGVNGSTSPSEVGLQELL